MIYRTLPDRVIGSIVT